MTGTDGLRRLVPAWTPRPLPGTEPMAGRLVRLERLSASHHAAGLYAANAGDEQMWDFMSYGPFPDEGSYSAWLRSVELSTDPMFFVIIDSDGRPRGMAAFLRIDPRNGVCELGHIALSPGLQRQAAATEALHLMAAQVFDLGYRRFEWKCNAANLPSRRAAERLGFSYEGTFRNHMVMKGRSRDTAWFAMTDDDWQSIAPVHRQWLDAGNFDEAGRQKQSLSALTRPLLQSRDPVLLALEA